MLGEHLSPVIESAKETVVADELVVALGELGDRQRRAGIHRAGQEVDLLDLEQLLGLLHGDGGVGLLVLEDQVDLPAGDAAGGIDLLGGEFETPAHLLADRRVGARERRHDADLDRVAVDWASAPPVQSRGGEQCGK